MQLIDLLLGDGPVIADGGMGSMLLAQGLAQGAAPEVWNIERPEVVIGVHRDYINAGAQIILTNSFGGNAQRLGLAGLSSRASDLNESAARLGRQAADDAAHPVVVAGSMGPLGVLLEPYGEIERPHAISLFTDQARALLAGGVDVFWIETMADLREVEAAVEACRRVAPELPVVTTMTFDTGGRTMMGVTPEQALATLDALSVAALGANCGNGPSEIETVIAAMHKAGPGVPLVAKANAGLPRMVEGRSVYDATPAEMAAYACRLRELGARIVGACCGSTPAHIQAIAAALKEMA